MKEKAMQLERNALGQPPAGETWLNSVGWIYRIGSLPARSVHTEGSPESAPHGKSEKSEHLLLTNHIPVLCG
jgi:hypothetical protein